MGKSFLSQIRYLARYLGPHRKVIAFSLVLSILSTALGMVQPFFAKILIDDVFLGHNSQRLTPLLVALIGLLVAGFSIRVGNNYIYTRYSAKFLFKLREDLFEHLQRIPLSFFSKRKIGDIYSRIASDMADAQGLITETVPHYLFNFLTCAVTATILLWLNWRMALLNFCFLPAALYILYRLRPKLVGLSKSVAEANADIAHFLFESLSCTSLVRAFNAEKSECTKLKEKHANILNFLLRYQVMGAFSGLIPTAFVVLNTLVVFGYGGRLILDGAMSIGSLMAFSIYQGRVFGPMQGLMDGFLAMQKSSVALDRVMEILEIQPAPRLENRLTYQPENLNGDITFENVSFAYDGEEPVFSDLSFHVPPGQVTALVGPSGVGKTTICHLILRLFDPDCGRITLDGVNLRKFGMEWLRNRIALVSQDTFLFHTTILENIRFSKPLATDEEIFEASKLACIHEFIQSLPDGYHTVVGDRGIRLSGGQKQRISIARAILVEPKILILDEPTAFLDSSVEERLRETIRSLASQRTTILVSHRLSTIQGADSVIALNRNGPIYEGPLAGFMERWGGTSQNPLLSLNDFAQAGLLTPTAGRG